MTSSIVIGRHTTENFVKDYTTRHNLFLWQNIGFLYLKAGLYYFSSPGFIDNEEFVFIVPPSSLSLVTDRITAASFKIRNVK